jgi:hypothetical protein
LSGKDVDFLQEKIVTMNRKAELLWSWTLCGFSLELVVKTALLCFPLINIGYKALFGCCKRFIYFFTKRINLYFSHFQSTECAECQFYDHHYYNISSTSCFK